MTKQRRQRRFSRLAVFSLLAGLLLMSFLATGASAASTSQPIHMLSRKGHSPAAPAGNLLYHGGRVMVDTAKNFAIFWEPRTGCFVSPHYHALILRYFGDVGTSPLYANNTQYPDSSGDAPDNAVLGGSWIDTQAYPGNTLTDAQVQAEVTHAQQVNGKSWTPDIHHIFYVFTCKGENICVGSNCSFQSFCAYYGVSGKTIYAAMPYAGTNLAACGVPQSPNKDLDADSEINQISHEQMEAATDPYGNAWYDSQGFGIAEACAWNFGPGVGDVTWHGHSYEVQKEWDNKVSGCVLAGP